MRAAQKAVHSARTGAVILIRLTISVFRIASTFLLYWFLLRAAEAIARSADAVHGQHATKNGGDAE